MYVPKYTYIYNEKPYFSLNLCNKFALIAVTPDLQAVLWRYKFSQLKGSSDDGKSKIKFLFQNQDSKSIEAKVPHTQKLQMTKSK